MVVLRGQGRGWDAGLGHSMRGNRFVNRVAELSTLAEEAQRRGYIVA